MIKIIFISMILVLSLNARENPFFADKDEKDIIVSSNQDNTKVALKRAAITLPSEARILQKVTIEYKNIDGSIDKKSIILDNSVNWHLPIFISQNYNEPKEYSLIKQKKIKNTQSKYRKIASIKYAKFYTNGKKLRIITKDKMIRSFELTNPSRIVMDFYRDSNMKSYSTKKLNSAFNQIRIGNHKGYYRVVLELDGLYKYNIYNTKKGCLVILN